MNIFKKFYYYCLCNRPYSAKSYKFLLNVYRSGGKDANFALSCLVQNIFYRGISNETAPLFIETGLDILNDERLSHYHLPLSLIKVLIQQKDYDTIESLMDKYPLSEDCYTLSLLPLAKNGDREAYNLMMKAFASEIQAPTVFSTFVFGKMLKDNVEILHDFIRSSSMERGIWNFHFIDSIYKMWNIKCYTVKELLRFYLAYNTIEDVSMCEFARESCGLGNQLNISILRADHHDEMKQREIDLCTKIEALLAKGRSQKEVFREYEAVLVNVIYTLSFFAQIAYLLPLYADVFSKIAEKLYGRK